MTEPHRIFVVEDEALINMELCDRLRRLGYEVCGTAVRGEDALRRVPDSNADVVLMDVRLAGAMDGVEVAIRLRDTSDAAIVFLTAYSDPELLARARTAGPLGYLVKPFDERELHATLQIAVAKREVERVLRRTNLQLEVKVAERTTALAAQEEDLRVTLLSIGDGVLATDAEGRITRLNVVAERLTGWSAADAMGHPIIDVFQPIDERTGAPGANPVIEVIATGMLHQPQSHIGLVARDGTTRSIANSAAPIYDAAGQLRGVVLVFRDETAARTSRRLVERQRATLHVVSEVQRAFITDPLSKQAFGDLLQGLVDGTASRQGVVVKLTRTEGSEVVLDVLAAHDVVLAPEELATLFDVVKTRCSFIATHADELPATSFARSTLLVVPLIVHDEILGVVSLCDRATAYDTALLDEIEPMIATCGAMLVARRGESARRAAEESLRRWNADLESEVARRTEQLHGTERERQRAARRFHDLVELAPDGIVLTDATGRVSLVNREAERIFGWSRDALIGRVVEDLVPNCARSVHLEQRAEATDARVPRTIMGHTRSSISAQRADGTTLPVEISLAPLETEEGVMVAAIVRDVSERDRLRQHAARAQRLDAIGTLAGGIAHDLNNALSPVIMALDTLLDTYPEASELINLMRVGGQRAVSMVRNLTTFAKGGIGERGSVELSRVVDEMGRIIRATFPKNIALQTHVHASPSLVEGNATELQQVLLNLTVNARDAMPRGGCLTVTVRPVNVDARLAATIPASKPGRYLVLSVQDTGVGIPEGELDRIFEPFFTTKGPEHGTGLGLASVLGIVRGHGGFVTVASKPGDGARFDVYFPSPQGPTKPSERDEWPVSEFRGREELVLYVDDESTVREAARTILERMNYTALVAVDGPDALAQVARYHDALAVVITDVQMPIMDGIVLAQTIRQMAPHLPLVVASGSFEPATLQRLDAIGGIERMHKPFTQGELLAMLRRTIG